MNKRPNVYHVQYDHDSMFCSLAKSEGLCVSLNKFNQQQAYTVNEPMKTECN